MGKDTTFLFQIRGNKNIFVSNQGQLTSNFVSNQGQDVRNGRWTIYLLQHCGCQECGVAEDVERSMSAYDNEPSRQSKTTIWSPTANI